MSNSPSLDLELTKVRKRSIQLLERRKEIAAKTLPSDADLKNLEKLRIAINDCRKEERFLSGRIKQLKNRFK